MEGSFYTALAALVLFVACAATEQWLLNRRADAYFALGLKLPDVRPVPSLPDKREGRTEHTTWTRTTDRLWFVGIGGRKAPMGLHGRVDLVRRDSGIVLVGRYLPPVTPFVALCWLIGLGAARGDLLIVVPIAFVGAFLLFWMHERMARVALDEIRVALVQG